MQENNCVICFEPLSDETRAITPCNHPFHAICVALWSRDSCPVCRGSLKVKVKVVEKPWIPPSRRERHTPSPERVIRHNAPEIDRMLHLNENERIVDFITHEDLVFLVGESAAYEFDDYMKLSQVKAGDVVDLRTWGGHRVFE